MIKNILHKLRKMPKRYVAAVAVGLAIAVPVAVQAGYGPDRPTLDWNNPVDRKGSLTGPVFNSFINTPTYGNEKAFVDAKDAANTAKGGFADTVNVEGGKEYTIRAYVHNNANQDTNASGLGVAKNTKFRFDVLPGVANGNEVTGYISADNATPKIVYDTVKLKNDTRAFSLQYVPGSARMESNVHPYPGIVLPDSIATTGTQIGNNKDGLFPGCFDFTEIITIKVRVITPGLTVQKGVTTVVAPKPADLKKDMVVKPGDTVTWRVDYKNNGTAPAEHITIKDKISDQLTLVPGSITWLDSNHTSGKVLQDNSLGGGGVDVGTYQPGTNGVIRYRTVVNKDTKVCEINNIAIGYASNIPDISDNAKITIDSDYCKPKAPIYSCDMLDVSKLTVQDRTYQFSGAYTAQNGATFKSFTYDFGDGSTPLTTDKTSVKYTYAKDGTYSTKLTANFTVNGVVKSATSANCTKVVTVTPEYCKVPGKEHLPVDSPECKVTPVTPTPATVLPNTGPGDVISIFAATSIAGAMIHKFALSRRFR